MRVRLTSPQPRAANQSFSASPASVRARCVEAVQWTFKVSSEAGSAFVPLASVVILSQILFVILPSGGVR